MKQQLVKTGSFKMLAVKDSGKKLPQFGSKKLSMKEQRSLPALLNIQKLSSREDELMAPNTESVERTNNSKKIFKIKKLPKGKKLVKDDKDSTQQVQSADAVIQNIEKIMGKNSDDVERNMRNTGKEFRTTNSELYQQVDILSSQRQDVSEQQFMLKNSTLVRRNSYDGVSRTAPLDKEAFQKLKLSEIENKNKLIARVLDNFEQSQSSKQERIKEMLSQIDANQRQQISKVARMKDPNLAQELGLSQQDVQIEGELRYQAHIEAFLENIALQNYDEAEKSLKNFCFAYSNNGIPQQTQLGPFQPTKKHVKFNMSTRNLIDIQSESARKPPLLKTQPLSQGTFQTEKTSTRRTISVEPEKLEKHNDQKLLVLKDILKTISSKEGATDQESKKDVLGSRKLLNYLQKKILFDQKGQVKGQGTQNVQQEKTEIEKEIEQDLNYLNVFVQPIGSINIFSREKDEQFMPQPKQEMPQSFDEELRNLILHSPLRPVVDERVLQLLNKAKRLDTDFTQSNGHSNLSYQIKALSEVLETIFQCSQKGENEPICNEIMQQILPIIDPEDQEELDDSPYLEGIDVAKFLAQEEDQMIHKSHVVDQSLFDLDRVRKFQRKLEQLMKKEDGKLTNDGVKTFLTEQFPQDEAGLRYDVDQRSSRKQYQAVSRQQIAIKKARKLTRDESYRNRKELGLVTKDQRKKQRVVDDVLNKIDLHNKLLKRFSHQYTISQSERQKLLYLSFVECARLVGKHSKQQALLMVKIWHEYFNHCQDEVRSAGALLHRKVDEITTQVQQLAQKLEEELEVLRQRDVDVLKLKHDYEKTVNVLEILTKSLLKEEQKSLQFRLNLENLEDNLSLIFPNWTYYMKQESTLELEKSRSMIGAQKWKAATPEYLAVLERQEKVEKLNEQIKDFRSAIIFKCGVTTAGKARNKKQEGSFKSDKEEDKTLTGTNPLAIMPGTEDEFPKNIHLMIAHDIERILRVLSTKITVQQALDDANLKIKQLTAQNANKENVNQRQELEIRIIQKRNTELTVEIVEQQNKYMLIIQQNKKEHEEQIEKVRVLEAERVRREMTRPKHNSFTQTVIDGDQENILRQREFMQSLTKYRGVNRSANFNSLKTTKNVEDMFMKGQPALENVYLPMVQIMTTVKSGTSKFANETKSIRNVLKMVAGLMQAKIAAMDSKATDAQALMNIDCFFYHHVQTTYGLEALANKYCEIYLASIEMHKKKDSRIELFRKFIGLDNDKLPYSIFERYVTMVKHSNMPVSLIYTQNITTMYVDYNRVRYSFKDFLSTATAFLQKDTYAQLKKYTRIITDNPIIVQKLTLEDYEVFKDLQDQTIRSRFKSTANVLQTLFDLFEDGDEALSDSDEAEAKTIEQSQLAEFLYTTFDLADHVRGLTNADKVPTLKRINHMIDVFLIQGQGFDPARLTQRDLTQGFREKVELRVPIAAFFHIGINAAVDFENNENEQLEKIYQFYTQVDVEVDEETGDMATRNVRVELNFDGMDFQQFVLFLKDAKSPIVQGTKRQMAFDVYRATCEYKLRQRLLCDDFVEAIRKYKLMPTIKQMETAMQDREIEIARFLRCELLEDGQEVPEEILEVALRKRAEEKDEEELKAEEEKEKEEAPQTGTAREGQSKRSRFTDMLQLAGDKKGIELEQQKRNLVDSDKGGSSSSASQQMLRVKISPTKKEEPAVEDLDQVSEEAKAFVVSANRRHSEVDLLDSKRRGAPPSGSSPLESLVESKGEENAGKADEIIVSVVEQSSPSDPVVNVMIDNTGQEQQTLAQLDDLMNSNQAFLEAQAAAAQNPPDALAGSEEEEVDEPESGVRTVAALVAYDAENDDEESENY